jgi:hypothetical protein
MAGWVGGSTHRGPIVVQDCSLGLLLARVAGPRKPGRGQKKLLTPGAGARRHHPLRQLPYGSGRPQLPGKAGGRHGRHAAPAGEGPARGARCASHRHGVEQHRGEGTWPCVRACSWVCGSGGVGTGCAAPAGKCLGQWLWPSHILCPFSNSPTPKLAHLNGDGLRGRCSGRAPEARRGAGRGPAVRQAAGGPASRPPRCWSPCWSSVAASTCCCPRSSCA